MIGNIIMENAQYIEMIIKDLAVKRKTSVNQILINSGVGKDFIKDMKRNQTPSVRKFSDLADYLNVSIDYLVGRTDNPEINK